ncbi:MAG: Cysteine-tRNA ligase [Candidatus Moranbacteria bacterium GW2011_GWF2_34_56]|nr:MAG: Cysteine-tRNA ligase [Candidatus Moranbacteria bacterium GW2011_GWF1_34_10]KKP65314.1 MAG: Cysteine-tRNA ligase [Candidatus Moranbacteria bacterium GW2011_GWF2_34_56]HBI16573.1 cysteine--tRNA ligase [Candidatus Moranbacteria bacterium]
MLIYNKLTNQKEEFVPINPGKVGMYVCGPTVYDHCHLGHGRGYVSMDVIRKYLEFSGYEVKYIMNYTDVGHLVNDAEVGEDKLERRAKKEKIDPIEIANFYIQSCEEDFEALNIKPAIFYPRPTKYIDKMINFIERLIEKDFAYESNGSVYFSVEKFPDYGKLSGRKTDELLAGARVEIDSDKKNPLDFALWIKADENHILKWNSPWSIGYPGWHIECSVMSCDLLGENTFDIHGGGNENAFPHNENEIAQSEALTGQRMANYWVLWNMVNTNGLKMGKSLGNATNPKEAIKKYGAGTVRLWIISSHYRSVMDFNENSLNQATKNLEKISKFINHVQEKLAKINSTNEDLATIDFDYYQEKFKEAMDDDFNTPLALSVFYDLITQTYKLETENKITALDLKNILSFWNKVNSIFSLEIMPRDKEEIPQEIMQLAKDRETARKDKNFQEADSLRDKLKERGYEIEDTSEGFKLTKN